MTVDLFPGPVVAELAAPGADLTRETVLPVEDRHRGVVHSTPEQEERQLRPLATGEIPSCFAMMAEPAPGAGSDPAALTTRAERVPGSRRIDGRKWCITGADGAGFMIAIAQTSGEPGELDANLFGGRQSPSSPARPRRTSPVPPSPSTAE
ncbi:hypothetical protein [Streptomyces griseorubiginosus]|uniref:hypothetical protein n=1 Tax=Streptomyces griseorubiginosus TaxID=67304 RepID=UPI0036EB6EDD